MNLSKGYWVQYGVGSLRQGIDAGVLPDVRPIDSSHSLELPSILGSPKSSYACYTERTCQAVKSNGGRM